MRKITFDSRALLFDGHRKLLLAGAIHYPRSTPAMWPLLFERSREAGLNTIETYVFWNLHERKRGVIDFSDRLDLLRFCQGAQQHGLDVVLRIGPYVCAETNFGGLPFWLRDVPGMQIRTWNEPFMKEKGRFVRLLAEYLRPMFAPNGGPIVMAQIENEYNNISKSYGDEGQRYLKWCVDLSLSLKLDIPWVMCVGAAEGAIESINHFYGHEGLAEHFAKHPEQPALWTEAYPAWYNTWGYEQHIRSPQDVAYATLRFFAGGGTGINYYMWQGGTNFGRETMYLQTTSYDFDAPLDEFGLQTTKSNHLTRVHHLLSENAELLLEKDRPEPTALGPKQVLIAYGSGSEGIQFLCNDDSDLVTVDVDGKKMKLAGRSVVALRGGKVLLDTSILQKRDVIVRSMKKESSRLGVFDSWQEPFPGDWPSDLRRPTLSDQPVEQLSLTHDQSDYCWYSTEIRATRAGEGKLLIDGGGDFLRVFVDGKPAAQSAMPLQENRTLKDNEGFKQTLVLKLTPGKHQLDVLCCALGLIKGDWMLGFQNMVNERKGIWGQVSLDGKPLKGWSMQPGLLGEQLKLFKLGGHLVRWKSAAKPRAVTWWRSAFKRPKGDHPLALDLAGMEKGLVWINGRCIGRHWLAHATGPNLIGPVGWKAPVSTTGLAQPTQRFYHIPLDWLADDNRVVIFEESGATPDNVSLVRRY